METLLTYKGYEFFGETRRDQTRMGPDSSSFDGPTDPAPPKRTGQKAHRHMPYKLGGATEARNTKGSRHMRPGAEDIAAQALRDTRGRPDVGDHGNAEAGPSRLSHVPARQFYAPGPQTRTTSTARGPRGPLSKGPAVHSDTDEPRFYDPPAQRTRARQQTQSTTISTLVSSAKLANGKHREWEVQSEDDYEEPEPIEVKPGDAVSSKARSMRVAAVEGDAGASQRKLRPKAASPTKSLGTGKGPTKPIGRTNGEMGAEIDLTGGIAVSSSKRTSEASNTKTRAVHKSQTTVPSSNLAQAVPDLVKVDEAFVVSSDPDQGSLASSLAVRRLSLSKGRRKDSLELQNLSTSTQLDISAANVKYYESTTFVILFLQFPALHTVSVQRSVKPFESTPFLTDLGLPLAVCLILEPTKDNLFAKEIVRQCRTKHLQSQTQAVELHVKVGTAAEYFFSQQSQRPSTPNSKATGRAKTIAAGTSAAQRNPTKRSKPDTVFNVPDSSGDEAGIDDDYKPDDGKRVTKKKQQIAAKGSKPAMRVQDAPQPDANQPGMKEYLSTPSVKIKPSRTSNRLKGKADTKLVDYGSSESGDELQQPSGDVHHVLRHVPRPPNPQAVLFPYPLDGPGRISISEGDKYRLQSGDFLNDTLLEFGLSHVVNEAKEKLPGDGTTAFDVANDVYLHNSFFYERLSSGLAEPPRARKDEYDQDGNWLPYRAVQKWTKNTDIFAKKLIIVPINENAHWYLAVIYNPAGTLREAVVNADDGTVAEGVGADDRAMDMEAAEESEEEEQEPIEDKGSNKENQPPVAGHATTANDTESDILVPETQEPQEADESSSTLSDAPDESVRPEVAPEPASSADPLDSIDRPAAADNFALLEPPTLQLARAKLDGEAVATDAQEGDVSGDIEMVDANPPKSAAQSSNPVPTTASPGRPVQMACLAFYGSAGNADQADDTVSAAGLEVQFGDASATSGSKVAKKDSAEEEARLEEAYQSFRKAYPQMINGSEDTWIITFDSLGGQHRKVANTLGLWLKAEARSRKGIQNPVKHQYREARVPQQPNFSDCGLYLIHFTEQLVNHPYEVLDTVRFLHSDVERAGHGVHHLLMTDRIWDKPATETLREKWTCIIDSLSEQYKGIRAAAAPAAGKSSKTEADPASQEDLVCMSSDIGNSKNAARGSKLKSKEATPTHIASRNSTPFRSKAPTSSGKKVSDPFAALMGSGAAESIEPVASVAVEAAHDAKPDSEIISTPDSAPTTNAALDGDTGEQDEAGTSTSAAVADECAVDVPDGDSPDAGMSSPDIEEADSASWRRAKPIATPVCPSAQGEPPTSARRSNSAAAISTPPRDVPTAANIDSESPTSEMPRSTSHETAPLVARDSLLEVIDEPAVTLVSANDSPHAANAAEVVMYEDAEDEAEAAQKLQSDIEPSSAIPIDDGTGVGLMANGTSRGSSPMLPSMDPDGAIQDNVFKAEPHLRPKSADAPANEPIEQLHPTANDDVTLPAMSGSPLSHDETSGSHRHDSATSSKFDMLLGACRKPGDPMNGDGLRQVNSPQAKKAAEFISQSLSATASLSPSTTAAPAGKTADSTERPPSKRRKIGSTRHEAVTSDQQYGCSGDISSIIMTETGESVDIGQVVKRPSVEATSAHSGSTGVSKSTRPRQVTGTRPDHSAQGSIPEIQLKASIASPRPSMAVEITTRQPPRRNGTDTHTSKSPASPTHTGKKLISPAGDPHDRWTPLSPNRSGYTGISPFVPWPAQPSAAVNALDGNSLTATSLPHRLSPQTAGDDGAGEDLSLIEALASAIEGRPDISLEGKGSDMAEHKSDHDFGEASDAVRKGTQRVYGRASRQTIARSKLPGAEAGSVHEVSDSDSDSSDRGRVDSRYFTPREARHTSPVRPDRPGSQSPRTANTRHRDIHSDKAQSQLGGRRRSTERSPSPIGTKVSPSKEYADHGHVDSEYRGAVEVESGSHEATHLWFDHDQPAESDGGSGSARKRTRSREKFSPGGTDEEHSRPKRQSVASPRDVASSHKSRSTAWPKGKGRLGKGGKAGKTRGGDTAAQAIPVGFDEDKGIQDS